MFKEVGVRLFRYW